MKIMGRLLPFAGLLLLLTVATALLASCDGDGDETTPTAGPTEAVTAAPSPTAQETTPPSPDAETAVPTTEPPVEPPPTSTQGPITIAIVYPEAGQLVPMETRVEVEVEGADLDGVHLYVLVRPVPTDPNQDYWVQAIPTATGEGRWKSEPVGVGIETDPSGTPFNLCAILTEETLFGGDHFADDDLPEGPLACVKVARE